MTEEDIFKNFANGGLSFVDAVLLLEKDGYSYEEAHQLVGEWADDLETKLEPDGDDYADRAEWRARR